MATFSNTNIQQQESLNEFKDLNNLESKFNPVQLTQIISPSITPKRIDLDADGLTKQQKTELVKGLGAAPFVYYNGIHIEYTDISNFELYHEGILPSLKVTFRDRNGIFKDSGFPTDDTIISIFLFSRSRILRSINMDFKISNFKDLGNGEYVISGICNVPDIFLKKFQSYSGKTSFDTLKDVSKQCGLGFCSNISTTKDKMTWINTGFPIYQFISNIVSNSYLSDSSFLNCYIDFYYNLCYLDIEKELQRDNSNDQMIQSSGKSDFTENPEDDEKIAPLLLTSDKSLRSSNAYISSYVISNNSTQISLNKSYLTKTKFYDSINKEILIFDIDSITSQGDKTLILKGKPDDDTFFKENIANIWVGKIDKFEDDGSGNAHSNYNYSLIQNRLNVDELIKLSIEITLPNPNFNLYIMEKVFIALINEKPGINHQSLRYKRITGNWLITSINYIFDGSNLYQKIVLIKRELELDESEYEQSVDSKISFDNNKDNNNPKIPNSST